MEKIFDNIYKIKYKVNIKGVPDVNSYLIKNEGLLIDAGPASLESYKKLQVELGTVGMSISDIKYLILTHHHIDHMGMLRYFPSDIKTVSDKSTTFYSKKDYLEEIKSFVNPMKLSSNFKNEIYNMLSLEYLDINWSEHQLIYNSNFQHENIEIFTSKGHSSSDSIIRYKKRYLFSGDIVIPKIFFNCLIDLTSDGRVNNKVRENYVKELNLLQRLDFQYLLPGHREVLRHEEGLKHIDHTLSRMARTERKVIKVLEQEITFEDVLNAIFYEFLKYDKYLPFSDIYSILEEKDLLQTMLFGE